MTGVEATRAVQTFLYERPNDFYAMPSFLIGENDILLSEQTLERTEEPVVYKVILFLSCSAFSESTMQKEGERITNLAECDAALRTNDAAKIAEIRKLLTGAVNLDIYAVKAACEAHGGVAVPAHVEKDSYSLWLCLVLCLKICTFPHWNQSIPKTAAADCARIFAKGL